MHKKISKAIIGNYFFTENQDNLSEKINFINNINYVYKGLNINKSVIFLIMEILNLILIMMNIILIWIQIFNIKLFYINILN